jgi:large subunit ribosomal protein L4
VGVYNTKGEKVSEVDLSADIFEVPVKNHILHQVVTMQLANRRAGTASTKERSDVRGGGGKPYRQKGTGRARAGTIRSPLMRGGGTVFGPLPRSFAQKVSKKIRKQALKMALATKHSDDTLVILDRFDLGEIKTKRFVEVMKKLKTDHALIVTEAANEILERSSRNIPDVKVLRMEGLNVYDILKFKYLVLLESALKKIEERLRS